MPGIMSEDLRKKAESAASLEPIEMVVAKLDDGVLLTSIAISLKRIADSLAKLAAEK